MLGLVLTQFDGIVAGYQAKQAAEPDALPGLSRRDLIFLNGNGLSPPALPLEKPFRTSISVIRVAWVQ